jgi:hypothetical protein
MRASADAAAKGNVLMIETLRSIPFLAVMLGGAGCATANAYTTPRALEPGRFELFAAPEVTYKASTVRGARGEPDRKAESLGYAALPPAVGVRVGVARGLDVGGGLRAGIVPGVDAKYNFYGGDAVDLALRAAVQGFYADDSGWGHAELATLVGVRVQQGVTLVASPGAAYDSSTLEGSRGSIYLPDGVFARLGLGARLDLGKRFALFPEMTAMHTVVGERRVWLTAAAHSRCSPPSIMTINVM